MPVPLPAEQTFQRAQTLLQSGRSVALPELLHLIETLSTSDATVPEIAELIEKDAALLGKVLSLANTVAHNPGIAPIRTLSQALHQIGYQRVRTMAVSLLLLENAGGAATPSEQREAAARALAAGLLAQGVAESIGTHDPEVAFACAALRQFGRILMAAISPELFREAQQLGLQQPPEENGFRRRFGLTSLELSRRVLSAARVPSEVLATLRDCEPEALFGTATQHETRLLALADYANRLASLSVGPQSGNDLFLKNSRLLSRRFERILPDVGESLKPAFRSADQRLRSYLRCKGVTALPTFSLSKIRQRLESVDPSVVNEGDGSIGSIFAPPKAAGDNLQDPVAPPPAVPLVLEESAAMPAAISPPQPITVPAPPQIAPAPAPAAPPPVEIVASPPSLAPFPPPPQRVVEPPAAAPAPEPLAPAAQLAPVVSSPPFQTTPAVAAEDPNHAALALIRDGFGAQECWLFHLAPGSTSFSSGLGIGPRWEQIKPRASLRTAERSVFGVCLARTETVVIHDASNPVTLPYLPAWLRETDAARGAFVLIPLTHGAKLVGLAFIGWHAARQITLSTAQLTLARQILSPITPVTTSRAA